MPPLGKAVGCICRERGVGGPGSSKAAAGHKLGGNDDYTAYGKYLVGEAVKPRENHIVNPEHEGNTEITKTGDQDRHRHPENHDGAVVGHHVVVFAGTHDAKSRHRFSRESQLHAKHVGHVSADQGHEDAGDAVLQADNKVVGREDIFTPETLLVMGGVSCGRGMGCVAHSY